MNKQAKLQDLTETAIVNQEFSASVLQEILMLKNSVIGMVNTYNKHTNTHSIFSGTYIITKMKPFSEAQFKSFRVEVFTGTEGALAEIKISNLGGSKTDRIAKRKNRKAKKILIPAATMWFKSGFKDTIRLDEFLKLTLKR